MPPDPPSSQLRTRSRSLALPPPPLPLQNALRCPCLHVRFRVPLPSPAPIALDCKLRTYSILYCSRFSLRAGWERGRRTLDLDDASVGTKREAQPPRFGKPLAATFLGENPGCWNILFCPLDVLCFYSQGLFILTLSFVWRRSRSMPVEPSPLELQVRHWLVGGYGRGGGGGGMNGWRRVGNGREEVGVKWLRGGWCKMIGRGRKWLWRGRNYPVLVCCLVGWFCVFGWFSKCASFH